ncbi:MAG: putative replicase [Circoviridae sp.]|nr:MAG: putative replicase [Circoviridae sp.]
MLKTFFIDYNITIADQLIKIIETYTGVKEYLLSHEEFNKKGEHKPHFHFYFKVDNEKTYNNLIKKIIGDYKLKELGIEYRKQTGKKGYRNYGTLTKKIYDEDYYKTYLCKDGTVWGSYSKEELQGYIDASFKAQSETELKEKIYKYVELNYLKDRFKDIINKNNLFTSKYKDTNIKLCIMEYFRENQMTITKTKINNQFNHFVSKSLKFSLGDIFTIMDF